uniref:Centrosomal protein of 70 kDa n=1 Tax=Albugo laibachii Nc14 TaxID=890382 RepID=F0WJF5_9STRA|nr:conserved unknown protein putative [Albugo laibachii Nc14]|eukprot:CCA21404.1 conserved unknown protein putative [Albugo laibachii Nc14]
MLLPELNEEESPYRHQTASGILSPTLSGRNHSFETNLDERESVLIDGRTSLELFIQQGLVMSSLLKVSNSTLDDRVETDSDPRFIELGEKDNTEAIASINMTERNACGLLNESVSDVEDLSNDDKRSTVHEINPKLLQDYSKNSGFSDDNNVQELRALMDDHRSTVVSGSDDAFRNLFNGNITSDKEGRNVESVSSPHSSYSVRSVPSSASNKSTTGSIVRDTYCTSRKGSENDFIEDQNGRHEEAAEENSFSLDQSRRSLQKNFGSHATTPAKKADAEPRTEEAWEEVNVFLQGKGLEKIELSAIPASNEPILIPNKVSLINLIHDVTIQLEEKDQKIQELIIDLHHASRSRKSIEEGVQSRERMLEKTNSNLETSRIQDQLKQTKQAAEGDAKKWKQSYQQLQQQLKTSERRVKTKELQIQHMKEKLQDQVDRQQRRKSRERELFRKLKAKYPKRGSSKDNEIMDCISIFSEEREEMRQEIEDLKIQVTRCNAELRDKENRLSRIIEGNGGLKKAYSSRHYDRVWISDDESCDNQSSETFEWREGDTSRNQKFRQPKYRLDTSDELLQRLEADRTDHENVIATLRQRESSMAEKIKKIQDELKEANETVGELMQENANLTVEAESRPTIREYRLCERRIHQLERKLLEAKAALNEAKDVNHFRKLMDTKDLIARDRLDHKLGLRNLDSLPRETLLEVVKDVCRLMNVADFTLISPNLEKLCKVVVAVPRMEAFIRDVCGFVYYTSRPFATKQDDKQRIGALEEVLPTLERWTHDLKRLDDLENFYSTVMDRLMAGRSSQQQTRDAQGAPTKDTITTAEALRIITDLMQQESDAFCRDETYNIAKTEIEQKPTILIHEIIRHFSHLFQVKSLEGVMPKINEIYLFVSEMQNFLKMARTELCLPQSKTVTTCLNEIRDRWRSHQQEEASYDLGDHTNSESITYVVEKPVDGHDQHLVGVRQVREMSVLIQQLKQELGASTAKDILPRTQRLIELLSLSLQDPASSASRSLTDDF